MKKVSETDAEVSIGALLGSVSAAIARVCARRKRKKKQWKINQQSPVIKSDMSVCRVKCTSPSKRFHRLVTEKQKLWAHFLSTCARSCVRDEIERERKSKISRHRVLKITAVVESLSLVSKINYQHWPHPELFTGSWRVPLHPRRTWRRLRSWC